jgi:hypothetical protein
MGKKLIPAFLLVCAGQAMACAEETECPPASDGAPPSEAGAGKDATLPSPDQGTAATCLAACTTEAPSLCAKD